MAKCLFCICLYIRKQFGVKSMNVNLDKDLIARKLKENTDRLTVAAFCIAALLVIIIGCAGLKAPVVPICAAVILEAAIAVMMHNVELWIHGACILVELIVGILVGRTGMMILCVVIYLAATAALRFLAAERK